MSGGTAPMAPTCPACRTPLAGSGSVEGLCARCLLSLGLEAEAPPEPAAAPGSRASRAGKESLEAAEPGEVTTTWMPADLLREASRRLELAAIGVGLAGVVSLVVHNAVRGAAWHVYAHPRLLDALLVGLVVVSAAVVLWIRRRQPAPRSLLRVGIAYEIVVAFLVSSGDQLEPLPAELPLAAVSWLCVWIVLFPLVVPARPRWALTAGLAAASTWPLAWWIGYRLGNPAPPVSILAFNIVENYLAVGLAVFASRVVRRLQNLGCYQLIRQLDHGGMGEIWLAQHRMLSRPVAIKLMRTRDRETEAIKRFELEAQATAALRSPHTVELYDFGVTPEGHFYYVMELLDGLDLESLVEAHGPLPPERVVHLLVQACDSLGEAHAAGLVHRDIKPGNIVSCHVGRRWDFVKVLDFGLVKSSFEVPANFGLTPAGGQPLTQEGTISGTPAYISPEMALGKPLDLRADLYGLGCVGYWLLTGERPFRGQTPMEIILHHVRTPPVLPSDRLGRPIPEALEALVLQCMAKEPEDRPPSAEWLASRLVECPLEARWTRERAREWWEEQRGEGSGRGPESTFTATLPSGGAWHQRSG